MSEELVYNSGRPRRTRSSMSAAVTPVTANPYKKPTYLVGRSNNATPDDSPDDEESEPTTPARGRRKPGRPFGSITKNRSTPPSTPRGGGRRGRGKAGGSSTSRQVEKETPVSSASSRRRGSTSTPASWNGKSRPECVASRNDRRSTGSAKLKKKRRGYNSTDYHYGSDFESDNVESEPEEPVPSESESIDEPMEDDMPLDEPLESDSDLSLGSVRLQGLPSIPVPVWMDTDAKVEELEIPRSSDDLLLGRDLLIEAVAIYEPLRRFSNLVRLSPFRFEDFCAALNSEEQSALLAEIHIQLLKALIREDEANGASFGPNECKDSIQSLLFFADNMTWAECLRTYVESDPTWIDIYKVLTSVEYPFCGADTRITILSWLVDVFMVSNSVRDLLTREGHIQHEDYCRSCNRLGELICCDTCPAVYHLGCIDHEDPPDDWRCPVCEHHELPGVSDCVSEIEKAGLHLRHEKLGYDRHGRKYWFLVRRILVESDDKSEVVYYSTRLQVEELLFRLDAENYEKDLVQNILYNKEEIFRQMSVTETVTNKMNTNHRKTYLDAENAFLSRIHEERELIRQQEAEEKLRIEERTRLAIKKELEEKQRLEEEERIRKEDDKRRIREERLAKRNQVKLKQRLGTFGDVDESVQQFLLNEESMDHEEGSVNDFSESSNDARVVSSDIKPTVENGDMEIESETKVHETEFKKHKIPLSEPAAQANENVEVEVKEENIKSEEKVLPEVKLEPTDIEPLVKTSILPKIAAKSKSLNLEVDSEERMTRLRSTGLYKLGQEGGYQKYVNRYTTDPLALSKNQHTDERDKRRLMSHKFSLTQASECKWSGNQQGLRPSIVAAVRQTLLNMEIAIPTTLMHCNWILLRKAWMSDVIASSNAKEFSKVLTKFAACLRPSVFNPVWSEGVGHVKLLRTSAIEKEIRKKNEKADKKFKDDEEDRLKLLPQFVKYSIPPKHQVWKQKGEEFRTHGNWGWIWLSNIRPAKPKDARTVGLLAGPHKHVIQVKGNSGKVKTMLIDPDVYNKLMAKRAHPLDQKVSAGARLPRIEAMDETFNTVESEVRDVMETLLKDVVDGRNVATLTSKIKAEDIDGTEMRPFSPTSAEDRKVGNKYEKPEASPSRKFRTELINVSLGIVSANRILYPKIAHEVKSLDTLLARRIQLQNMEEKRLLEEYGAAMLESIKGPPPVLDKSPITITVDSHFPLSGGYSLSCYSNECKKAAVEGKTNFEAQCYSPMCRLKYVIMDARRRKIEKERLATFEKANKARQEIEEKRSYNQSSTSEKVFLQKLPSAKSKNSQSVKYPLVSKFCYHSSKRASVLVLPQHELMKLGRTGGRTLVPTGFTPNPRPNTWLWPYPCGRPFFKTTWQYRTVHCSGLHAAALQLRVLYACVRWDDIQTRPLNPEGKSQITTDMEVITSEILDHRIVGRFLENFQYLRRRHIVPIDAPKTIREVTPSRSGLRKRKRAESPDNAEPEVKEEWVDEDKFEVWEIRLYGEKLEKKNEKKPEPPSNSTRSKTGVTIRVPEKWDPSPKETKEKELVTKVQITPKTEFPETELATQRIVHLSKRDNHAKITTNPNKVPTPTASQQLLQQQSAAAAAAKQGLALGTSPATKAVNLTQTTSPSGRKFFVTKPTLTVGANAVTNPTITKESPKMTGILKKPSVSTPLALNSPQNVAATALINSTSTGARQGLGVPGTPISNQKFQILRSLDGKIQVKGLGPGQHAYQMPDGKIHVVCSTANSEEKSTLSPAGTVLNTVAMLRSSTPSSTSPAINQPRVNISNPAIRTAISNPTSLVRPTEVKKVPILKQALPPQIITVNRTANDLKDNPLHLQTPRGIIEVRANNITKSATGQDQIVLGPGLPTIQLLPRPTPTPVSEPPPLEEKQPEPIQPVAVTSSAPTTSPAIEATPTPLVTSVSLVPQTQAVAVSSPTASGSVMGNGSRIMYNDGNRSFILNTAGYSETQVNSLINHIQQRRIVVKSPEAGGPITQAQLVQQVMLPQSVVQGSPQQIFVGSIASPPRAGIQQIATIGGQKVFINRASPVLRQVTAGSGSAAQVFQRLVPASGLTGLSTASPKSIAITPPVGTQVHYRASPTRPVIPPQQASVSRAALPISIVSPSKPRLGQSGTPVRLSLAEQQSLSACSTPQTLIRVSHSVTTPQKSLSTTSSAVTQTLIGSTSQAAASPKLPTILRGSGAGIVPSMPAATPPKNKLVAQVINTPQGPRLMLQGLPPKLSPALVDQLEAQLTKQLVGTAMDSASVATLVAGIRNQLVVEPDPASDPVATAAEEIHNSSKTTAVPKLHSLNLSSPTPKPDVSSEVVDSIGAGTQSAVVQSEVAVGPTVAVRNGGTTVKRTGAAAALAHGAKSPVTKKRKTNELELSSMVPEKVQDAPPNDFVNLGEDVEARFVLSQDLVGQSEPVPVPVTSPLDASTSLPLTDSTPAMSPPVKAKPVTSTTSTVTLNHQGPKAPSSLTTPAKPSRRKSPVRSDLTQSAKANVAAQNKLLRSVHNHKELLKRDIFKRRALLEKELLVEIQAEVSEELQKQGLSKDEGDGETGPATKTKLNSSDSGTRGLKTTKGRSSLPSAQAGKRSTRKSKSKKKGEQELICICQTPYENTKFCVGCDVCDKWFHGECVGLTEELAECLSDYVCDNCQAAPTQEVFCICRQPYDDTQFYIECDKCDDWFHGRCVGVLSLEGPKIDQYLCPTCDPDTLLNHANLKTLTDEDYVHIDKLLKQIQTHKSAGAFREPVDITEAPNYYRVIKEPMDLQTIEARVEQKCYTRLCDFIGDITKIFENCRYYNQPESKFHKSANILEAFFAQKIKVLRQKLSE